MTGRFEKSFYGGKVRQERDQCRRSRLDLELWSGRHPAGARVEDLLTFAREIFDRYQNYAKEVNNVG